MLAPLCVLACGRIGFDALPEAAPSPPTFGDVVKLSTAPAASGPPSIAWNGGGFTVAWAEVADPGRLIMCKVAPTGDITIAPEQFAESSMGPLQFPTIAANPDGAGIGLVRDEDEVWFTPFNEDNDTVGIPRAVGVSADLTPPGVAVGHDVYAVAWSGAGGTQLALIPFDASSTLQWPITNRSSAKDSPLVGTTEGFFAVWTDQRTETREIYGVEVGIDGALGDEVAITSDGRPSEGVRTALRDRNRLGVAWGEYMGGAGDERTLFTTVGLPSLEVAEPLVIADDTGASPDLGLASSGGEFVLVFEDEKEGVVIAAAIRGGAFVSAIASPEDTRAQKPAIAWGGGQYGMVWLDDTGVQRDVYFRTLTVVAD